MKSEKPIVLMIDEVDSATNNQVFLDFLAQLRFAFLEREADPENKTFQSVILAGVTDVRHLKSKIRDEDQHKVNSPWNIRENNEENGSLLTFDECTRQAQNPFALVAVEFSIDMRLSEDGIRGMLADYESDHHTGMEESMQGGFRRAGRGTG